MEQDSVISNFIHLKYGIGGEDESRVHDLATEMAQGIYDYMRKNKLPITKQTEAFIIGEVLDMYIGNEFAQTIFRESTHLNSHGTKAREGEWDHLKDAAAGMREDFKRVLETPESERGELSPMMQASLKLHAIKNTRLALEAAQGLTQELKDGLKQHVADAWGEKWGELIADIAAEAMLDEAVMADSCKTYNEVQLPLDMEAPDTAQERVEKIYEMLVIRIGGSLCEYVMNVFDDIKNPSDDDNLDTFLRNAVFRNKDPKPK